MSNFDLKRLEDVDVPAVAVFSLVAASGVFEIAQLAVPWFSGTLTVRAKAGQKVQ